MTANPTPENNPKPAASAEADAKAAQEKEDKMVNAGAQTVHEMRDAMTSMVDASTKMMQAFIDMRLSYLKVMRAGLDDPDTAVDIMVKNTKDLAKAAKNLGRKDDAQKK